MAILKMVSRRLAYICLYPTHRGMNLGSVQVLKGWGWEGQPWHTELGAN